MKTKHHPILSASVIRSGETTMRHKIHPRFYSFGLYGILFISTCALLPFPAKAECEQYDVSGEWAFRQGSYFIRVALSQNGNTISGTAKQNWVADHQVKVLPGQVTGTITGSEFDVQINWNGGGAGVYRGSIARNGTLYGTTYDLKNLRSTARWESEKKFQCADATLIPPRKVIKPTFPKTTAPPEQTRGVVPGPDDYKKLQDEVNKAAATKSTSPIQLATPTPSPTATEASSSDTEDQPKKKKKKGKHHHHDDDENQGND